MNRNAVSPSVLSITRWYVVMKSTLAPASPGFATSRSCARTSASSNTLLKAGES